MENVQEKMQEWEDRLAKLVMNMATQLEGVLTEEQKLKLVEEKTTCERSLNIWKSAWRDIQTLSMEKTARSRGVEESKGEMKEDEIMDQEDMIQRAVKSQIHLCHSRK